jgi:hypothetical protein
VIYSPRHHGSSFNAGDGQGLITRTNAATDLLRPGAILANSSVILGLAKLKASDVLNPDTPKKPPKRF